MKSHYVLMLPSSLILLSPRLYATPLPSDIAPVPKGNTLQQQHQQVAAGLVLVQPISVPLVARFGYSYICSLAASPQFWPAELLPLYCGLCPWSWGVSGAASHRACCERTRHHKNRILLHARHLLQWLHARRCCSLCLLQQRTECTKKNSNKGTTLG